MVSGLQEPPGMRSAPPTTTTAKSSHNQRDAPAPRCSPGDHRTGSVSNQTPERP